jgi:hypothetical protein
MLEAFSMGKTDYLLRSTLFRVASYKFGMPAKEKYL